MVFWYSFFKELHSFLPKSLIWSPLLEDFLSTCLLLDIDVYGLSILQKCSAINSILTYFLLPSSIRIYLDFDSILFYRSKDTVPVFNHFNFCSKRFSPNVIQGLGFHSLYLSGDLKSESEWLLLMQRSVFLSSSVYSFIWVCEKLYSFSVFLYSCK